MKKFNFLQIIFCIAGFFILLYGRWNVKNVSGESSPTLVMKMNKTIPVQCTEYSIGFFDNDIPTLSALEQETDIVIRASILEGRTMSARSTKTEICINEVLSQTDADLSAGDIIYLLEPVTFLRGEIYNTNGYQIAHTGEEYIFLLKHLECVEGYQYTKEQEITYMPVSVYYSKYAASHKEVIEPLGSGNVFYGDIQDYAILTNRNDVLSQYETLMNQVIEKYNKQNYYAK